MTLEKYKEKSLDTLMEMRDLTRRLIKLYGDNPQHAKAKKASEADLPLMSEALEWRIKENQKGE